MARSNKPLVWVLFAAGGTLAAFVLPAVIFSLTLGVALGWIPLETLSYERAIAGLQPPLAKLAAFGVLALILWHAAHRLRITARDLGIYADSAAMLIFYGMAVLGAVAAFVVLLGL
jgi:succinate dehydrogenase subunit D